jgi:hypothetical protein
LSTPTYDEVLNHLGLKREENSHSIGELHVISDQLSVRGTIDFGVTIVENERLLTMRVHSQNWESKAYVIAGINETILMHQTSLLRSESACVVTVEGIVGIITHSRELPHPGKSIRLYNISTIRPFKGLHVPLFKASAWPASAKAASFVNKRDMTWRTETRTKTIVFP